MVIHHRPKQPNLKCVYKTIEKLFLLLIKVLCYSSSLFLCDDNRMMQSYSQRFRQYHRYFSSLTEELLAIGLFPITYTLYSFNLSAQSLSDMSFLPHRADGFVWRAGRN